MQAWSSWSSMLRERAPTPPRFIGQSTWTSRIGSRPPLPAPCPPRVLEGSEYPAVVIPVMTQHYAMLQRNLLYTGVTRGKRLVVLVGQKKAVAIAVRNVSGRRRWSKVRGWLSADASKVPYLPPSRLAKPRACSARADSVGFPGRSG